MSKENNLTDFLTDVADAIREKKGTTDKINPQDFSDEISKIPSSDEVVAAKAVAFYDCDGRILYTYTKEEFLALTEMPPLPYRKGLICQEWNWDFDAAREHISKYKHLNIGATYITNDGKTRLYISFVDYGVLDLTLYFNQTVSNGVIIDWGDGSGTQSVSGTGNKKIKHKYNDLGDYIITFEVVNGEFGFGNGSASTTLLGHYKNDVTYLQCVKYIEIGRGMKIINTAALYAFYGLAWCSIPNGVTTINGTAFANDNWLNIFIIPKSVTTIGSGLFNGNTSLKTLVTSSSKVTASGNNLGSSHYVFDRGFLDNNIVRSFQACNAMTVVDIADTITTINSNVFKNNISLPNIKIPKSVTTIAAQAFYNCWDMQYYDFSEHEAIPALSNVDAFYNMPSDCQIIVPDSLYDEWIISTNWSELAANIVKSSEFKSQKT